MIETVLSVGIMHDYIRHVMIDEIVLDDFVSMEIFKTLDDYQIQFSLPHSNVQRSKQCHGHVKTTTKQKKYNVKHLSHRSMPVVQTHESTSMDKITEMVEHHFLQHEQQIHDFVWFEYHFGIHELSFRVFQKEQIILSISNEHVISMVIDHNLVVQWSIQSTTEHVESMNEHTHDQQNDDAITVSRVSVHHEHIFDPCQEIIFFPSLEIDREHDQQLKLSNEHVRPINDE